MDHVASVGKRKLHAPFPLLRVLVDPGLDPARDVVARIRAAWMHRAIRHAAKGIHREVLVALASAAVVQEDLDRIILADIPVVSTPVGRAQPVDQGLLADDQHVDVVIVIPHLDARLLLGRPRLAALAGGHHLADTSRRRVAPDRVVRLAVDDRRHREAIHVKGPHGRPERFELLVFVETRFERSEEPLAEEGHPFRVRCARGLGRGPVQPSA